MMKRMKAVCMALLLCALTALPCSAAAKAETKTIDVYARAVRESDAYTAPVEDGVASVKLNDGTSVTVTGVPDSGLWLVVYPIPETEREAWDWFESCMEAYGTHLYPMEIYFIDQDGNRTEAGGVATVTVRTPGTYETPVICRLLADGQVTALDGSAEGKRISFRMDRNGYYVLAEKKVDSGSETEETGDSGNGTAQTSRPSAKNGTGSTGNTSPKTGDDTGIWLWIAVMCMSAAGAVATLNRLKKIYF